MIARWLAVLTLVLAACGAKSAGGTERSEIVDRYRGQGFWCIGTECYRTAAACKAVDSREGIPGECVRAQEASCFTGDDRDNLTAYTVCYRDYEECTTQRIEVQQEVDYLEISRCVSTR